MSVSAYARMQRNVEAPRQTEYRLFAQVTAALLASRVAGTTGARLVETLDWNRRLWSALATDCGMPGNQLPQAVRAQIISIALWVSRYSSEVVRGEGDINDLIEVNRMIMDGLAAHSENVAADMQAAASCA